MKNKTLKLTLANMAAITLIATQGTAVFANDSSSNVNTASNVPGENTDETEKYPEDIIEETKPKLENEKKILADIQQQKTTLERKILEVTNEQNLAEQKFLASKAEHKKIFDRVSEAEKNLIAAYEALNQANQGQDEEAKREANKRLSIAVQENVKASNEFNANRDRIEKEVSASELTFVEKQRENTMLKANLDELNLSEQKSLQNIKQYEKQIADAQKEIEASELERYRNSVREAIIDLEAGKNYNGLSEIKQKAIENIEKASSKDELDKILESTKKEVELIKYKNEAIETLKKLSSENENKEIKKIVEDAINKVKEASTKEEVNNIVKNTEEKIKEIKEKEEALKELNKVKEQAIETLKKLSSETENKEIIKIVEDAINKVKEASTKEEVNNILKNIEAEVQRIKQELKDKELALLNAKNKAKKELIEAGISNFYIKKIDSAKTIDGVENIKELILKSRPKSVPKTAPTVEEKPRADINLIIAKDSAKKELTEAGISNFYIKKIDSAKTIEGVKSLKELILKSRYKSVPKTAPTLEEKPKADIGKIISESKTPKKSGSIIVDQPNLKGNNKVNVTKSSKTLSKKLPNTGQTTNSYIGFVTIALAFAVISRKKLLKK